MTLTEFLLARIAEEEVVAVATRDSYDPLVWTAADYADTSAWGMGGPVDGPSGYESIVIDPARVLAECEAKRRIVARFSAVESQVARAVEMGWDHKVVKAATVAYDDALLDLASVYADHPDYRDEWKP